MPKTKKQIALILDNLIESLEKEHSVKIDAEALSECVQNAIQIKVADLIHMGLSHLDVGDLIIAKEMIETKEAMRGKSKSISH